MKIRRMGCLQLKRCLSFLPAAFVVYILLHYFVYQPDIQETRTAFLGGSSSSHRIVKLSASDPVEIKETVLLPNGEQPGGGTSPSDVVGLPHNSDSLPSPSKEEIVKPKLNDLSIESRNGLELSKIIDSTNQSDQGNLLGEQENIAPTIATVVGDDKSPTGDVGLSNEINSIPQDSNKDESLFAHSSAINDYVMKSFQRQRALELKSMLVRKSKSKVTNYFPEGSNYMKPNLEGSVDNRYSVAKDAADEPMVETVYDFFPSKNQGLDLSANYVPASSKLKPNTNVINPVEDFIEQPVNNGNQIAGTSAGELSPTALNYGTQDEGNIGSNADIGNGMGQELPSEEDSIIVPRELLSREDNNLKKKYELIEEKEKAPSIEEIRKGIPEGSGISVGANFNSSQLLESLLAVSQNEKSQPSQSVKKREELNNNSAEKLVPELKSNNSRENQSRQPSSKQPGQVVPNSEPGRTVPKSETPLTHATAVAAASSPAQSKNSSIKPDPKVSDVTKAKNELHKKGDPPGFAIRALNGPVTVDQRYEKGFATAHEDLCPNNGRDLKVLILITTAPDHEKHRNAVRQTWGHFSMRRDIAMAFVVGRTARTDIQNVIDKENDRYGDIIEANFVDHYSNLTLKTVSMFEWTKTYCSEARFVLKTDDDMYINVPLLLAFIIAKNGEKRAMFGRLAKGWKPVRNTKSKYYIDTATYSRVRYPDFVTGPAYLFTNDIVEEVYQKVLNTTFFVLEDVLITGIVGESLGVKRVGDSHFRNEKIKLADTCKLMQSISIHMVKYEEQFDIYKRTLDGKTKCKTR